MCSMGILSYDFQNVRNLAVQLILIESLCSETKAVSVFYWKSTILVEISFLHIIKFQFTWFNPTFVTLIRMNMSHMGIVLTIYSLKHLPKILHSRLSVTDYISYDYITDDSSKVMQCERPLVLINDSWNPVYINDILIWIFRNRFRDSTFFDGT